MLTSYVYSSIIKIMKERLYYEYIGRFINELNREGKSSNTISAYAADVRQFNKWLCDTLGNDTNTITEIDIKQYVQYLNINKKQSTNTINRKVKSIVQYVKYLNNTDISNIVIDTKDVKQRVFIM